MALADDRKSYLYDSCGLTADAVVCHNRVRAPRVFVTSQARDSVVGSGADRRFPFLDRMYVVWSSTGLLWMDVQLALLGTTRSKSKLPEVCDTRTAPALSQKAKVRQLCGIRAL